MFETTKPDKIAELRGQCHSPNGVNMRPVGLAVKRPETQPHSGAGREAIALWTNSQPAIHARGNCMVATLWRVITLSLAFARQIGELGQRVVTEWILPGKCQYIRKIWTRAGDVVCGLVC